MAVPRCRLPVFLMLLPLAPPPACGATSSAAGAAPGAAGPCAAPAKPHIVFILQDDLGRFDTGFLDNDQSAATASKEITSLAREGIVLDYHYVHWHCSPTRRSLLTGRLPIHHGELQSGIDTDDIDLRWAWISDKLRAAGYRSYWYGKGGTGYRSMRHLPAHHGFSDSLLFLVSNFSYTMQSRWRGQRPAASSTEYSTDLFGRMALEAIQKHDPGMPMFLYLPWQAVHRASDLPPSCAPPSSCPNWLWSALADSDRWTGRLVQALKAKGMWGNTLLVYSSDNGGVADGSNYPLRGEKHTSWEGAMRSASFVGGGLIPKHLRGTTNPIRFHIVDWYSTLAHLAGASPNDPPPEAPLPVDPMRPQRDIYQGDKSWPDVDGVNIWPMLMQPSSYAVAAAHPHLTLSAEVRMEGRFKLLVAQPTPKAGRIFNNGWRQPDGTWEPAPDAQWPCNKCRDRSHFTPCLFDIYSDPEECTNLAAKHPDIVTRMWAGLNLSMLSSYTSRSPSYLVGPCNRRCATKQWEGIHGPICGVPGCSEPCCSTVFVAQPATCKMCHPEQ